MVLDLGGWLSVPALISAMVGFGLAGLLVLARPDRPQNRYLAFAFFCFDLGFVLFWGARGFLDDPSVMYGAAITARVAWAIGWIAFVHFLSTLDSPWTRPLKGRAVRGIVSAAFGAKALSVLVLPRLWVADVRVVEATGALAPISGPTVPFNDVQALALLLFVAGAIISAYRRSAGGLERRKMRLMTIGIAGGMLIHFTWLSTGWAFVLSGPSYELASNYVFHVGPPVGQLFIHTLLAYGILTTQLFDIDLKVKWGIRQGTVAAIFIVVVLVATEGAQILFGEENAWLGLAAAAVLALALAPLQRLAETVSDAAMPDVEDSDEYLTFRKHEVFRHAVEEAVVDGTISEKEQRVLSALKADLGIGDDVAGKLERDVLGAEEVG